MNRMSYSGFGRDKNPYLMLIKPKIESCNVFQQLLETKSILLTLYDSNSREVVNHCDTAPAPSKDYCQLLLTYDHVVMVFSIEFRALGDKSALI
jgi:hypothetical protein